MSVVDHIVVAVDFSEPSRVAVRAAMQLANTSGTKSLTILHALRPTVLPHGDQPALKQRLVELRARIHSAAQAQMRQMVGDCDAQSFAVDVHVVEGTPSRVIPLAARDLGGTVLAMGTHGRRGIYRWLKGSVVEAMLPHLHLPTLIFAVGEDGVLPETELAALRHVTVAVDTHDGAERVTNRALEALTGLTNSKPAVTLTTVIDVPTPRLAPDDALLAEVQAMIQTDAVAALEKLRAPFDAAGFSADVVVRTGDIDEEILSVAAEHPSQLIVLGTHGAGERLFDFSSVAAEVVRNSNVTVLVLPSVLGLHG